jgi:hypothetical protein
MAMAVRRERKGRATRETEGGEGVSCLSCDGWSDGASLLLLLLLLLLLFCCDGRGEAPSNYLSLVFSVYVRLGYVQDDAFPQLP